MGTTIYSLAFRLLPLVFLFLLATPCAAQQIKSKLIAFDLDQPTFVTNAGDDSGRLFVTEKESGKIKVIQDGIVQPIPFLDLGSRLLSHGNAGLLCLAFHPEFASNGRFFVKYVESTTTVVISEFMVPRRTPNRAFAATERTVLRIPLIHESHSGGSLAFGPNDGYLYIGTGDGGAGCGCDPNNLAQDFTSLSGKMLRIDVDHGSPYAIPPSNPFVGTEAREEIWAYGLRNPWRWSFDAKTGDMYIADVGNLDWEEISFQPAESPGGVNFGWRLKEGDHCFNPSTDCEIPGLNDPILEYAHGGSPQRCAVIGGYVYRGKDIPGLQGTYFFSDFCSNQVSSFHVEQDGPEVHVSQFRDRTDELQPELPAVLRQISTFGQDEDGELYVVAHSAGLVFKIIGDLMSLRTTPFVAGEPSFVTVTDATPKADVLLYVSNEGRGVTRIPFLDVNLGLDQPMLRSTHSADEFGELGFAFDVPASTSGRTMWLQAAEYLNTSNVEVQVIE